MKKNLKNSLLFGSLLLFPILINSCDKGADEKAIGVEYVITFEDADGKSMAGPSSYGDNAYALYTGAKISPYTHPQTNLSFNINKDQEGIINIYNGGAVVSDWNFKSNTEGKEGDWWYSYMNQCSVYAGTDGEKNGGLANSKNFAVITGFGNYQAEIKFNDNIAKTIKGMYVCNSAYTYGVIMNGNSFGTQPLPETKGYFKLKAYGYNGKIAVNNGNPVEIYLADYREGEKQVPTLNEWTYFDTSALGEVSKIVFDFEGSDSGQYGLNTPAYVCLDNIFVMKPISK